MDNIFLWTPSLKRKVQKDKMGGPTKKAKAVRFRSFWDYFKPCLGNVETSAPMYCFGTSKNVFFDSAGFPITSDFVSGFKKLNWNLFSVTFVNRNGEIRLQALKMCYLETFAAEIWCIWSHPLGHLFAPRPKSISIDQNPVHNIVRFGIHNSCPNLFEQGLQSDIWLLQQ